MSVAQRRDRRRRGGRAGRLLSCLASVVGAAVLLGAAPAWTADPSPAHRETWFAREEASSPVEPGAVPAGSHPEQLAQGSAAAAPPPFYVIGPLDTIEIFVRGHEDLTMTVPVRPDGRVSVPLADDLLAVGKTPSQLAGDIEKELGKYIRNPLATVTVVDAKGTFAEQIRVVGVASDPTIGGVGPEAVRARLQPRPRSVTYRQGITLFDVITELGGLSAFADGNAAVIIRRRGESTIKIPVRLDDLVERGDVTANMPMAPGDVLVVPEGFYQGEWEVTYSVGAFATFTDNVNLVPSDIKNSALIFTLQPGISIRGTSSRIYGGLDASVDLNFQEVFGNNRLNTKEGLIPALNLLGTTTIELAPDLLFVDASASVTQQTGNIGDASSLSQFVNANRSPTGAFRVSPYVPVHLGSYADAELRYTFGASLRGDRDFNDLNVFNQSFDNFFNTVGLTVRSGSRTSQYGPWTFQTFGSMQTRSDQDNINQAVVRLDWAYPLTHRLFLLAGAGWQVRDDGVSANDINAPIWALGARWAPHPDLDLTATYGQLDDRSNIYANLRYRIGPRTNMFVNFTEGLSTSGAEIVSNTAFLQIDPATGQFINNRTGAVFNPRFPGSFNNNSQFFRNFTAGITHSRGPNVFRVNASAFQQEPQGTDQSEERFLVSASWSRQLNLRTNATLFGSYQRSNLRDRDDNTYSVSLNLTYDLYRTIQASAFYGFQTRDSTFDPFDFTENVVTIGIVGTF